MGVWISARTPTPTPGPDLGGEFASDESDARPVSVAPAPGAVWVWVVWVWSRALWVPPPGVGVALRVWRGVSLPHAAPDAAPEAVPAAVPAAVRGAALVAVPEVVVAGLLVGVSTAGAGTPWWRRRL